MHRIIKTSNNIILCRQSGTLHTYMYAYRDSLMYARPLTYRRHTHKYQIYKHTRMIYRIP